MTVAARQRCRFDACKKRSKTVAYVLTTLLGLTYRTCYLLVVTRAKISHLFGAETWKLAAPARLTDVGGLVHESPDLAGCSQRRVLHVSVLCPQDRIDGSGLREIDELDGEVYCGRARVHASATEHIHKQALEPATYPSWATETWRFRKGEKDGTVRSVRSSNARFCKV